MIAKLEIPEGVEVNAENNLVKVKGSKGEVERNFVSRKIAISKEGNEVVLLAKNATKREKTMMNTFRAHIKNMFKGVVEGHKYELKVCSGEIKKTYTGFSDLDFYLNGLEGDLITLAAESSIGKTAFALNLCYEMNVNSMYIPLESRQIKIAKRYLKMEYPDADFTNQDNLNSLKNWDNIFKLPIFKLISLIPTFFKILYAKYINSAKASGLEVPINSQPACLNSLYLPF